MHYEHNMTELASIKLVRVTYPDQTYLATPSHALSFEDDVLGTTLTSLPSLWHFFHENEFRNILLTLQKIQEIQIS